MCSFKIKYGGVVYKFINNNDFYGLNIKIIVLISIRLNNII